MNTTGYHNGIIIDYTRDRELPEQGLSMLTKKGFYKLDHEKSPQETFARAATCYSFGDYGLAQRLYNAASKGWFTFASPVLSNAVDIVWPDFDEENRFQEAGDWLEENVEPNGMPISCFLGTISDKKEGLVEARKETAWLSMMGGGVGLFAGNRSPDEKSTGVMAHLRGYDADTLAYKQKETRRGSIAAYLDIDHPEILNFIDMRNPVGGDQNKKCFNLNNAVVIPDSFMEKVKSGEDYELVDPKHGGTGKFLSARAVWEKILEARFETGEPYIMFKDTVNKNIPSWVTDPLYTVSQSNLCSEITLHTDENMTAVCCLSSLNLEHYDEWRDTGLVKDLVIMLDNVLEYFIRLAPRELQRAVTSASYERALGLGTLGFHSYLQKNMIPFESGGFNSASQVNAKIYKDIKEQAHIASTVLAVERGETFATFGSGVRNSHLLAVAPNASSSSLVGASPSIEPYAANAYNAQGRAGSFLIKNKFLHELLKDLDMDTEEVWDSIIINKGSVQHLDISDEAKAVFKTSSEIDQRWIVEHASTRQQYICQSQSLNIFVPTDITLQEMSDLHMIAWEKGVKTLYYCRAEASSNISVGTGGDAPLNSMPVRQKIEYDTCLSCEG